MLIPVPLTSRRSGGQLLRSMTFEMYRTMVDDPLPAIGAEGEADPVQHQAMR